ncbi:cytochrome P450 [Streptomyces actuosus]|uniref:Cytochrome P450 n=1 Tax=Streptomyces actuosus TaxID=1885 RepID=A0ABS2VJR3_STRAS|nr:cytochrome P450 [Streptomyces actuosus]MBN0043331.1 cytochrome P450 [Streptomyces actuosus]
MSRTRSHDPESPAEPGTPAESEAARTVPRAQPRNPDPGDSGGPGRTSDPGETGDTGAPDGSADADVSGADGTGGSAPHGDPAAPADAPEAAGLTPLPGGLGWVVTGRSVALGLLGDQRLGVLEPQPVMAHLATKLPAAVRPELREITAFAERVMLQTGHDRHMALRRAFGGFFDAAAVDSRVPGLREDAERVVRRFAAAGGGEFMTAVAFPYAVRTGARLVGVTDEEYRRLHRLSQQLALVAYAARLDDPAAAVRAGHAALVRVRETVAAARAAAPRTSVLGAWHAGAIDLPDEDVEANAVMLVQASLETVAGMLGNTAARILTAPGALADPARRARLLDDALRAEPPLKTLERVVREPVTAAGHSLRPGQIVSVRVADANRPDADPVAGRALFSFGWGAYRCLGARLARHQAAELFAALHRIAPDAAAAEDDVERVRHIRFDMPRSLRVRCTPPPADGAALTRALTAALEEDDLDRPLTSLEREVAYVVLKEHGVTVPEELRDPTTIREWVTWATQAHG